MHIVQAYGMGVDKQNIRSVIHRDLPQSIESFLQEAGRGGRDRKCSQAILLVGPGDIHLHANKYNDFSEARKNELISWIYEEGCLRAGLLQRMGIQETACFGCSVCHPDPPLEKNSYWSRMKHLCKELVGKRNQWVIQAAAQRICEEYFWDSCCIPTKRISQLPAMPEWDVFSTEKFLQDISKLSQAECSLFCRLLGISTVQVKDSS